MNKTLRTLFILKRLSLNDRVCIKELARELNINIRNLQNDFKLLREYFLDRLVKRGDCYYLLNRELFIKLFKSDSKTTREFLKLVSIIDTSLYNRFKTEYSEVLKALKIDSSAIYQIENSPYENLKSSHKKTIERLESAISNREYIDIIYEFRDKELYFSHSIPVKILYLNDNWYLSVLTTNDIIDNSMFKNLRISSIISIKTPKFEPKRFDIDNIEKLKAEEFLKDIQSAYSSMDKPTYPVIVRVSKEVARFFRKKRYLKSQIVEKEFENGDILVSYRVCNDMEIIPLIQNWIPYIRVVEPLRVKEKILQNLQQFMNQS